MRRFWLAAAIAIATPLSGCYSLALNAQGYTKPVSLSAHTVRPARVVRHFKREATTWYLAGVLPVATIPGQDSIWVPADRLVNHVLHQELARSGDGVINLRVRQEMTPTSIAMIAVPAAAIGLLPGSSPWAGAAVALGFQPIHVTIEGDVVEFR